jgi:ribosomal protein S24E
MPKRIVHDNSNNKLTKKLKNQIPSEYNQERTLRIIRKQNEIPGECRTKTLNDYYRSRNRAGIKRFKFPSGEENYTHIRTRSTVNKS